MSPALRLAVVIASVSSVVAGSSGCGLAGAAHRARSRPLDLVDSIDGSRAAAAPAPRLGVLAGDLERSRSETSMRPPAGDAFRARLQPNAGAQPSDQETTRPEEPSARPDSETSPPEAASASPSGERSSEQGPADRVDALDAEPEEGANGVEVGMGFTADPETFLLSGQYSFAVLKDLDVGPHIQLGFNDDELIFAPTLHFEKSFLLPRDVVGPRFDNLRPSVQGGIGMAYVHKEGPGDNDDVGFLFNLGFGADYFLTKDVAVGSSMLFNILPDEVLGENFYYAWEFLTLRWRF